MSTGNIIIPGNSEDSFYGLVICGGQSNRMGTDKSMLIYYDKPQRYHLYEMMQPFCEKVFLSCNETQAPTISHNYDMLPDLPQYKDQGPVSALLTAFKTFPGKDFLVTGCDYPFFKDRDIAELITASITRSTTCFYNAAAELYEPVLGYYSRRDADLLFKLYDTGILSLQSFLKKINAGKFYPPNAQSILSADSKADYLACKKILDVA